MSVRGPWTKQRIEGFLREARVPIRLACNGARGHPVLASLWFVRLGDELWCATQRTASLARHLERDPRCAFEVAAESPPYRGVRGQGRATLHDERGLEILRLLIDRYLDDPDGPLARWLLIRAERETAIAIEPHSFVSWDYTERMATRGGER